MYEIYDNNSINLIDHRKGYSSDEYNYVVITTNKIIKPFIKISVEMQSIYMLMRKNCQDMKNIYHNSANHINQQQTNAQDGILQFTKQIYYLPVYLLFVYHLSIHLNLCTQQKKRWFLNIQHYILVLYHLRKLKFSKHFILFTKIHTHMWQFMKT